MEKTQDPEAAETDQTESIKAVDPAAICSPVRDDIFGWFGDAAQTEPEHDPGPDAPCPICVHSVGRHSLDNPIKTISLMVEDPAKRQNSFFFRAHKRCWEMVSDHDRSIVESALVDHIVDADKMVAPEHHFRDAAKMVGLLRPDSEGFWWELRKSGWKFGEAKVMPWEDGEESVRTLCLTVGGVYMRCDRINEPDRGERYFPAVPPFPANNPLPRRPR